MNIDHRACAVNDARLDRDQGEDAAALEVLVLDNSPSLRKLVLSGRLAWAMRVLIVAGNRGVTPIETPGPRWSSYVHKIRRRGVSVATINEAHGAPFAGTHARYVLKSSVRSSIRRRKISGAQRGCSMGRRRRSGKAGDRHVRLHHWMMTTPAWRTLTPTARSVLLEIYALYDGTNNGVLHLSVREAARRVLVAPNTARKALDELIERKFIRIAQVGSFSLKVRHATTWIIAEFSHAGGLPGRDFMHWRPAENQEPVSNRSPAVSRPDTGTLKAGRERGRGISKRYREAPDESVHGVNHCDTDSIPGCARVTVSTLRHESRPPKLEVAAGPAGPKPEASSSAASQPVGPVLSLAATRARLDERSRIDARRAVGQYALALSEDAKALAFAAAAEQPADRILERALASQAAAGYAVGMSLLADAEACAARAAKFRETGDWREMQMLSTEASRSAQTATKLLDSVTRATLALERLRHGPEQRVVVQHQHVTVADGGQAVVAGGVVAKSYNDGGG